MAVDKLQTVFSETLGLPAEVDWSALAYRKVPEWDSVAHMQLVGEIEEAFGVMLDTADVLGMSSFAAARDILSKHGVAA
ncbi:acyl carrier protein [Virgisporangium aliadipatigenens]|uniref:Acyl carrier protein n=1 Tax=Virgisporangium aliadipatigenens TaxID=741659 RepID=A0A8J3YY35_9ACTN|nr:acyl carrier protein [Virgisporangium aliadipatigenens]GIJ51683.1 acyl carrier protein [Virgisporangium aliadipatigenens]